MKKTLFFSFFILLANVAMAQLRPITLPKKTNTAINYNQLMFFEHANYQGKGYKLSRGCYNVAQLGVAANDFFSSAIIPSNLVVMVFENDNLQGNCYILQSDNASSQPNKDLTQARIAFGKDTENRKLSGTKDLNDLISSILVFDPNKDNVTLFEHCDNPNYSQTENMTKVYPGPLPTQPNSLDAFNYVNGNWGWNSLEKLNYFNDRTSSLFFGDGHVIRDAVIYENIGFSGQSNSIRADMRCFKNLKYSDTSKGIFSSDWNDRTSAIIVRLGTSYVEIMN